MLLRDRDPEWREWSDREIARWVRVGNQLVGDVRRSICVNHTDAPPAVRTVARAGKTYEMRTEKIGRKPIKPRIEASPADALPSGFPGETNGEWVERILRAAIDSQPAKERPIYSVMVRQVADKVCDDYFDPAVMESLGFSIDEFMANRDSTPTDMDVVNFSLNLISSLT